MTMTATIANTGQGLLAKLISLKKQGEYLQALECAKEIADKNLVVPEVLYQISEIYYYLKDDQRAFHYIQGYQKYEPRNLRIPLFNMLMRFRKHDKKGALELFKEFFTLNLQVATEAELERLDEVLEIYQRNFKSSKLLREAPLYGKYQKWRRKMLKLQQNSVAVETEAATICNNEAGAQDNASSKNIEEPVSPHVSNIEHSGDELKTQQVRELISKILRPMPTAIDRPVEELVRRPENPAEDARKTAEVRALMTTLLANAQEEQTLAKITDEEHSPVEVVDTSTLEEQIAEDDSLIEDNSPEQNDDGASDGSSAKDMAVLQDSIEHIWEEQCIDDDDADIILKYTASEVTKVIDSIVLSYNKKVQLYNIIAGLFYRNEFLEEAVFLLRQALLMDDEDDLILKNLGYVLSRLGEKDAATIVLQDIPELDFMVQDMLVLLNK